MNSKTKRFIWVAVVIKFIIVGAIITVLFLGTLYVVREISERGLKSIIEEIWEGPDSK